MSFVDTADETAEDVVPIEGTVKWFDPVKGYGFVVPDQGGVDILVHHSTLRRGGYDMLYPMARIKCTIVEACKDCRRTALSQSTTPMRKCRLAGLARPPSCRKFPM